MGIAASNPFEALTEQITALNKILGFHPNDDTTLLDNSSEAAPKTLNDDNPEDHQFEEAARWAKNQKKDFKNVN